MATRSPKPDVLRPDAVRPQLLGQPKLVYRLARPQHRPAEVQVLFSPSTKLRLDISRVNLTHNA